MATSLAERIVQAMARKGYGLAKGFGEINIVYIEGLNPDGTPNGDAPNAFNDLRVCLRFENGEPKIVGAWEATTEPGTKYIKAPINPKGAAIIKFGQYRAWQVGIHRAGSAGAHEALVQTGGAVTVHRDANQDGLRTGDAEDIGYFGINQHWGYDLPANDIGGASAGCLVGRTREGHREFMRIVKSDPRFEQNPQFVFTTTILPESDVVGSAVEARVAPAVTPTDLRLRMAKRILDEEARRDRSGKLAVYRLPSGDGGGTYEVAGINERYHPQKAAELRKLVESGRPDEAERIAVDYIAAYTDCVTDWYMPGDPGVQFFLRDTAYNRGTTGAARIFQDAVGVRQDGIVREGGETRVAAAKMGANALLEALRQARERYERTVVGRDESSKFWAGLSKRWDRVLAFAKQLSAEKPLSPSTKDILKGGAGATVGGGVAAGVQQGWGLLEWAIVVGVIVAVAALGYGLWRWRRARRLAATKAVAEVTAPDRPQIPPIAVSPDDSLAEATEIVTSGLPPRKPARRASSVKKRRANPTPRKKRKAPRKAAKAKEKTNVG